MTRCARLSTARMIVIHAALLALALPNTGCGRRSFAAVLAPLDPLPNPAHWVETTTDGYAREQDWAWTWDNGSWNGIVNIAVGCPSADYAAGARWHTLVATFRAKSGSKGAFAPGDTLYAPLVDVGYRADYGTGIVPLPDSVATTFVGHWLMVYDGARWNGQADISLIGGTACMTTQFFLPLRLEYDPLASANAARL